MNKLQPNKSYNSILKSTSLIGGSEVARLMIGMIQSKFVAIFLGPVGVGLSGTYGSVINLVHTFSSLGIARSGVREIAVAVGSGDQEKIGRSVLTLRRISWLTGTLGALLVVVLSPYLSQVTFDSTEYAWALACLAWIILLRQLMAAQMSYIQGLRRIGDLAKLKIIGAFGGAVIGIGYYAWLRLDGIVPALLTLAIFNLISSSWYARKLPAPSVNMSWQDSFRESKGFLQLGAALMIGGLCSPLLAYWTRVLILEIADIDSVGIFQSSFRLSALFVNFVLQAMVSDYLPRLTAIASDKVRMKSIINEQTEIGLLLSVPGLLATLSFAPWIIQIFYTNEFLQAAELLKWFVMGCLLRVISFPLGHVLTATARKKLYIYTEVVFTVLHLALIWVGLKTLGIFGVSVAFFLLYCIYTATMRLMMGKIIGFSWSKGVNKLFIVLLPVVVGIFISSQLLPTVYASSIGLIATVVMGCYCLRELSFRVGPEHKIFKLIRRIPIISNLIVPSV